ncbi:MAG TPA: hypothetical protein V6D12_13690 [Candidatus Obscuribacterales bacterium]
MPQSASAVEAFKAPDGSVVIVGTEPNTTQIIEYTNITPKRRIRASSCGMVQLRETADLPLNGAVLRIGSETIQVDSLAVKVKPRCREGKLINQPND